MRHKAGRISIIFGCCLLLSSLGLFLYNQTAAVKAETASAELVSRLQAEMMPVAEEKSAAEPNTENAAGSDVPTHSPAPAVTEAPLVPAAKKAGMPVVTVDGVGYVGCITVPALELVLPVADQWDYDQLALSPCRFSGATDTDDLVIMGHNYEGHFRALSELSQGDQVLFQNMDGVVTVYRVEAIEVLGPEAVEDMTAGVYDLSLFTCTYGGGQRVTVRCDREQP